MSSGVVRSAISSILDDSVFTINSENAKMLATSLLDAIIGDDWRMDRFDAFSSTLLKRYKQQAHAVALDKRKSYSCSRERAWATFYSFPVCGAACLTGCSGTTSIGLFLELSPNTYACIYTLYSRPRHILSTLQLSLLNMLMRRYSQIAC